MNGPEPTWLSIALNGSVSARRLGIMNGTFDDGLPSESSTRPYGSLSAMVKVLSFTAFISATNSIIFWPIASRAAQRLIEATQSSAVTGLPSCHSSPSRRVKVHSFLSADTSCLSTICGFTTLFSSLENSVS
jgi:hypothetical protein